MRSFNKILQILLDEQLITFPRIHPQNLFCFFAKRDVASLRLFGPILLAKLSKHGQTFTSSVDIM